MEVLKVLTTSLNLKDSFKVKAQPMISTFQGLLGIEKFLGKPNR